MRNIIADIVVSARGRALLCNYEGKICQWLVTVYQVATTTNLTDSVSALGCWELLITFSDGIIDLEHVTHGWIAPEPEVLVVPWGSWGSTEDGRALLR
jgi:hypothetical protein